MSDAVDRFVEACSALQVEISVRRFPQGTKTAADAAAAIGCEVGQIVKSLVFMTDGGDPVLALTSGSNRVDETRLASFAGVGSIRRATPDEARVATGFAVGVTPPFGYPRPVASFCDRDLLVYEEIWAAAGTPDSVFPLNPAVLVRCSGASIADLAADVP
jgi:prolyl-tRNA editing enzyme YbaK/EbsC (Cys-tRNA(Pro) deacylase)